MFGRFSLISVKSLSTVLGLHKLVAWIVMIDLSVKTMASMAASDFDPGRKQNGSLSTVAFFKTFKLPQIVCSALHVGICKEGEQNLFFNLCVNLVGAWVGVQEREATAR